MNTLTPAHRRRIRDLILSSQKFRLEVKELIHQEISQTTTYGGNHNDWTSTREPATDRTSVVGGTKIRGGRWYIRTL